MSDLPFLYKVQLLIETEHPDIPRNDVDKDWLLNILTLDRDSAGIMIYAVIEKPYVG